MEPCQNIMTDKIYMIQLIKNFNSWNKDKIDSDRYNYFFLENLGYKCELELCCKYIYVYYNENKKKLIVLFDGVDKDFIDSHTKLNIIKTNVLFQEYIIRVQNVVNTINNKYSEYNKLYLGYCLGGYMINNYVCGKNITAYTYNSYFFRHNNENYIKIINYCEILDYYSSMSLFFDRNVERISINSHNKYIGKIIDNLINFDLNNLNTLKILDHLHSIYTVDENIIVIEF